MKVKLAEALLRRKELQQRVDRITAVQKLDVFEMRVKRINVTESIDEVTAAVPKMTRAQVDAEHDFYAKRLRMVDAIIQQANWTTELDAGHGIMDDYVPAEEVKN